MKTIIPAAILFLILQSCGTTRKPATSRDLQKDAHALNEWPALPPSSINIPVKVYMRPLLTALDASTADSFTNTGWPAYTQSGCDFRYKYLFLRSPFRFQCFNNRVTIGFNGRYQIAGSRCICAFDKQVSPWVGGSCGYGSEPMRNVYVQIGSLLQFQPDHRVLTSTHIDQVNAYDKCQVTLMNNDITTEVLDSIKASVESYGTSFDQFVQDLNQQPFLVQWRQQKNRVMRISRYGFLNLFPSAYSLSPMNTDNDTLKFTVGFNGMPAFSTDSAELSSDAPLPSLSPQPLSPGLTAYFNASLDFPFINRLLNDSLDNKPFVVEGRTFVIRSVNISGSESGSISIDLSFTGNRTGVLHLSGTPQLDTTAQVLSMNDLRFSLDSRDMLLNMAKGLFRKKILRELRGQSVFDLAALFDANRNAINQRLNQPLSAWMNTYGSIDRIRVRAIRADARQLRLQFMVTGQIGLLAQPPASILYGL